VIDAQLRFGIFIGALIIFSTLEFFFEYRERNVKRKVRWLSNISLIFVGNIVVKVLLPSGLGYFSLLADQQNLGLFNNLELGTTITLVLSIVLLDLLIYFQHMLSHKVNFLWRFHRVHHADIDLDASSALRFHPLEILFSIIYKILIIFVFGFSFDSILIFEVLLNFTAMFNHSNLGLNHKLERIIRFFIVTPQMHIVHHSVNQCESDTNYGFNLSIWDRLFGTYSKDFSVSRDIGQSYYREVGNHKLIPLLTLPFKRFKK
jgi:sterol desaturase/sphingolipid hydroxylase (fatty acid hydroxylase superfamily)